MNLRIGTQLPAIRTSVLSSERSSPAVGQFEGEVGGEATRLPREEEPMSNVRRENTFTLKTQLSVICLRIRYCKYGVMRQTSVIGSAHHAVDRTFVTLLAKRRNCANNRVGLKDTKVRVFAMIL